MDCLKWLGAVVLVVGFASWTSAQVSVNGPALSTASSPPGALPGSMATPSTPVVPQANPDLGSLRVPAEGVPDLDLGEGPATDPLKGTQKFQNFIGFISNPLQSVDPRSITEMYPIFASYHVSATPALPSASMQLYGAGLTVAVTDRLSVGLNQGGWAQVTFNRNQPGLFPNLQGIIQNRSSYGGVREGWLDIGGFVQYTFIQNVEEQFLMTGGLKWVSPSGAAQLFQGSPPWQLAPYITVGKEIEKFHLMGVLGYNFAAGDGKSTIDNFYVNLHLDRQCFGWFYPLIEINSSFPSSKVAVALPTRFGYIDFGDFSSTGNIVQMAVGATAVLIPNKAELGAVYTTTLASQRDFDVDGIIVRLNLRY